MNFLTTTNMHIMKISLKTLLVLPAALLIFSLPACHDHHNHGHDHSEDEAQDDHEASYHLTRMQIDQVGIEYGDLTDMKINDYIEATGTLGLPPNAYSSVSAKAEGFIAGSNKYIEGSYIRRGTVMAWLENPEFIQKQQDYLEVKAKLDFLRRELERQEELVSAEAGVQKDVERLEADVLVQEARLKGTAGYLAYLGLDVAGLTADNIRQRIAIKAPISGYLTSINMHNGMFVEPKMELMEIVDESHLHLELDVFEKDIALVKDGQHITYSVPAVGNTLYEGEVHIIGKEFNTENKTVRVHGHLEKERPLFIKDLFITAKIWLTDQTVPALPEEAIIKDGVTSYIFAAGDDGSSEEVEFEKINVLPGVADNGYVAVKLMDEIPEGMRIVTSGAFYIYAQSMSGELEHSH